MDQIKQLQAFVESATRGSLSAAAKRQAVTPAVIGRRLDALETRLGRIFLQPASAAVL